MVTVEDIPRTYDQAVRVLARWHGEDRAVPITIHSFPDAEGKTVRFIEVSDAFPSSDEVQVFGMGRSKEFPFRSMVALVTPEEWRRIQDGDLSLPEGWNLENRNQVWPDG